MKDLRSRFSTKRLFFRVSPEQRRGIIDGPACLHGGTGWWFRGCGGAWRPADVSFAPTGAERRHAASEAREAPGGHVGRQWEREPAIFESMPAVRGWMATKAAWTCIIA